MEKIPVMSEQRFFKFRLDELIDLNSEIVRDYVRYKDADAVKEMIIRDIQYPFFLGQPDDSHWLIAFWGRFIISRLVDYWQTARETLTFRVGDCEDSSVAFVTAMRVLGYTEDEVYEVIGLVKDKDGNVLGGHGWSVFKDVDGWHLYESTLDEPPREYPKIDDITKPVQIGGWVYEPYWIFNDKKFIKIKDFGSPSEYMLGLHSVDKYKAIHDAWGVITTFEKQYNSFKAKLLRVTLGWFHKLLRW